MQYVLLHSVIWLMFSHILISDEINKVILNLGLMVLPVQNAKSFW